MEELPLEQQPGGMFRLLTRSASAYIKQQVENESNPNGWVECFTNRLFSIETELANIPDDYPVIPKELYQERLEDVKERRDCAIETFGLKNIPPQVKRDLVSRLFIDNYRYPALLTDEKAFYQKRLQNGILRRRTACVLALPLGTGTAYFGANLVEIIDKSTIADNPHSIVHMIGATVTGFLTLSSGYEVTQANKIVKQERRNLKTLPISTQNIFQISKSLKNHDE